MTKKKPKHGWLRYWPRLLYVIPFGAALWVPSYNRLEPTLSGIPFFYWYQLAWILLGALVVLVVYLIETRVTHVAKVTGTGFDAPGTPGDIL